MNECTCKDGAGLQWYSLPSVYDAPGVHSLFQRVIISFHCCKQGGMHHSGALDDRGDEEEEDLTNIQRHRNTEERGTPSSCGELLKREEDEV